MPQPLRIAVDTGGTFTDCVWVEAGRVRMAKVFSTPADPSQAIAQAVENSGNGPVTLLHGTTVGTNTLLQGKGARVALVTTAGFEDAIEIGRQARPKLYDFFFDRVEPLVGARLRFGVKERMGHDGRVVERLSSAELSRLSRKIAGTKAEAIAICLLFSFANPEHERALVKALTRLELPLSVSHKILPEFREYERTSTVVINACLQPVMQRYLQSLEKRVEGSVFVMQSSGGITSLRTAASEPVRTVLSGPAGGVVGAAAMARRSGLARIISLDIGGTSSDVALVDGEIRAGTQAGIAGWPIGVPILDIHTVGAGGGSIARFDAGGALRVGPESAGADPGPICYGRGTQPTVTDANLLLGRLRPDRFLGGQFALDLERTRDLVRRWLKQQDRELSLQQFASGVIRVINSTMEKAIRLVSIERGYDPRDFALVAFGGAGGLHACDLALALGISRVIVPAMPGALSAYGILVSDVVKDYSRTVLWRVAAKIPGGLLDAEFKRLKDQAKRDLSEENWKGRVTYQPTLDVRYTGQGYELNVPYTRDLSQAFETEHRRRYGYGHANHALELVTLRLRATVKSPAVQWKNQPPPANPQPPERAPVFLSGKSVSTPIYERASLVTGKLYAGPAIVTEYSGTTLIPPRARFQLERAGNLLLTL